MILSILGVFIGNKIYVPFYFSHGLAALCFYGIGHFACSYKLTSRKCKVWAILLALVFVMMGMGIGEPYFYSLYFPNWIVNTLAAISATYLFYFLCRKLSRVQLLTWMAKVGRLSLLVLCVHGIDGILGGTHAFVFDSCGLSGHAAYLVYDLMLIAVPLLGMSVLSRISLVKKVINIK